MLGANRGAGPRCPFRCSLALRTCPLRSGGIFHRRMERNSAFRQIHGNRVKHLREFFGTFVGQDDPLSPLDRVSNFASIRVLHDKLWGQLQVPLAQIALHLVKRSLDGISITIRELIIHLRGSRSFGVPD